jgi:hypothetical protein
MLHSFPRNEGSAICGANLQALPPFSFTSIQSSSCFQRLMRQDAEEARERIVTLKYEIMARDTLRVPVRPRTE